MWHTRRWPLGAVLGGLLLWGLMSPALGPAQTCQGMTIVLVPGGYQSLAVSTVAVSLTLPSGAAYGVIDVEGAGIRYRVDNTAPTTTEGHAVADGGELTICGGEALKQFKAIRSGGSDATLRVSYFKAR